MQALRQPGEAVTAPRIWLRGSDSWKPCGYMFPLRRPDSRKTVVKEVGGRLREAKGGRVGKAQNAHDPLDTWRVGSGYGRCASQRLGRPGRLDGAPARARSAREVS